MLDPKAPYRVNGLLKEGIDNDQIRLDLLDDPLYIFCGRNVLFSRVWD